MTAVVCPPENHHEYQNRGTDQKMINRNHPGKLCSLISRGLQQRDNKTVVDFTVRHTRRRIQCTTEQK
ncbi:hypothetical protein BK364_26200 [Escherichia coli]|nr:hypothetical protein BK337_25895 [Escherichia coli]OJQ55240.1 hypothetical protein BK364_26200 [Escherichia coli]